MLTHSRLGSGCLISLTVLVCLAPVAGADMKTKEFSDEKVEEAIAAGVKRLWELQENDGSWSKERDSYPVGISALVTYALLETGISPRDPRMAKALDYLKKKDTEKTYSLGVRCQVWLSAGQNLKNLNAYGKYLKKDVRQLILSTKDGSYNYDSKGKRQSSGDHSNSQYGLLGVWAGSLANLEIPRKYWQRVLWYWGDVQNKDGGWSYKGGRLHEGKRIQEDSTNTMTAAGIASLYVCLENLQSRDYLKCQGNLEFKPLVRGLKWFDNNFAASLKKSDRWAYYLYGVERIGLASGYKYFGGLDWYKQGANKIISRSKEKHSAKDTSFMLLFLIRGRNPVAFNKLEYQGRWNNRPRDLANLTRWLTTKYERTVNWQIVNLRVPTSEWHDAPILYIAGDSAPTFSDEEIHKLRDYVLQGGTILSVAECKGLAFTTAMKKVYAKMLPQYELKTVPMDHPFYNLRSKVRPTAKLRMITNGVRPLVIHTNRDMGVYWQAQNFANNWSSQTLANIYLHQTDLTKLHPRGVAGWPEEFKGRPVATVKIARLKHAGNYNPEPLAWVRFGRMLAAETGVTIDVTEPMSIADLPKSNAKLAVMTGTESLTLTEQDIQAIQAFLKSGGKLFIDAAGGSQAFANSARNLLPKLSDKPGAFAIMLQPTHPLFTFGDLKVSPVSFRGRATKVNRGKQTPQLMALPMLNPNIFFSAEDVTAGLVGYECYNVSGLAPESAYKLMRNIVLHCANIKPDQLVVSD